MNIWILRFAPYGGPMPHDLFFRSESAARKARAEAFASKETVVLKDDFGIELALEPGRCAIMLTNCESSAAFTAALNAANGDAARTYNLMPGQMRRVDPGSSLQ